MPVNMNPAIFPEPTLFNPDRFMDESAKKSSMLSFSTGVRACLARNLALLKMSVVLANFLRSYDIQLPSDIAASVGSATAVDFDKCGSAGIVPNIPHETHIAMTPANPDRDCRVLITRAASTA
ncbi:hypothetical protein GGH96_001940 [Coemansia sp. RSA 1972]|nr:hypothetical protein GGH96_001940 [Coemansia sp. RSA 1972]